MTIATKLSEARLLIERGWCRGEAEKHGRFCMIGAVARVTPLLINSGNGAIRSKSLRLLFEVTGVRTAGGLANWNDRQKSKRPVIEAFKRAEQLARDGAE